MALASEDCELCHTHSETHNHLRIACAYSREVWEKILEGFNLGSHPFMSWDSAC